MIYKVLYQKDQIVNPRRETTQTLYLEADNMVAARSMVEDNTPYNIELIQELTGNSLKYEQEHADFKLTDFSKKSN
jgi:DNA-dependent RNA polymerase auxiliary subunit epsilon